MTLYLVVTLQKWDCLCVSVAGVARPTLLPQGVGTAFCPVYDDRAKAEAEWPGKEILEMKVTDAR